MSLQVCRSAGLRIVVLAVASLGVLRHVAAGERTRVFSVAETFAGPRLSVDGVVQPAVAALPSPFVPPGESVAAMRSFADVGVRLFSNVWSMRNRPHDWWLGEGRYDWAAFDNFALRLLESCPDGWIMPRIKIEPPAWWLAEHAAEVSPSGEEVKAESLPWRVLYRRMLRDMVAHVAASPYGGRVAGYHVGGLHCGEWMDFMRVANGRPPVPERFAADPMAPESATAEARAYLRERARAVADALIDAAAVIKGETHGEKVVCAFFGYAQCVDHEDFMRVVRSGLVDMFAAPAYYEGEERGVGAAGVPQAYYTASYALHGRLFFEEADPRTSLAVLPPSTHSAMSAALRAGRPADIVQSVGVLKRIVGRNLAQGTGLWWFLIAGNDTFRDAALMEVVRVGAEAERLAMMTPRPRFTDVAVFTKAAEYSTSWGCHTNALYEHKRTLHVHKLPRVGVAYDSYEFSDMANPRVADYAVYLLPNAHSLSGPERQAVDRLAASGKRIVMLPRPVGVADLRRILADAGAHVWLDSDDVVFVGRGHLVVHASSAGIKHVRLPFQCDVEEIFGASPVRRRVREFNERMELGDTRVWTLRRSER